ncbi:glycosyltransferase [Kitasatospora sp. NBC_01302]|uniref:glycosyltransferase n=1 Tax=Kitasatospora sp. NBC_01302 TaxID=2903575 RepID=UPI002E126D15|nr:glycosyltransferase [Kitasatospora sp. NBC_01302]
MKILFLAGGSQGDVAPFTGLGVQLRQAGHEVAIATQPRFAELVGAGGLEFRALPGELRRELSPLRQATDFVRQLGEGVAATVAPGDDLLLLAPTTAPLGWSLAEAHGIPSIGVYLQPVHPTAEFAPAVGAGRSLGRWGNRAAGHVSLRLVDRVYGPTVTRLRAGLGLPPMTAGATRRRQEAAGWPVLYGYSPSVLPRPADWRSGLDVVGNWWPFDAQLTDHQLPAELADFLQAGPPPVFIGFGSMGGGEGERLSELAVRALRRARVRGVVQAGWAGLSGTGEDVITVGELPHLALFPRMAAVVHHAGAGTTAAALRAGVPAVPVPVLGDQPFWANLLARLGAGTAPIPFKSLTADRLAAAITRATGDPVHRTRATALAGRLAAEDGAGRAVELIERTATEAGWG